MAMNKGKVTLATFLDYSKAFDTVDPHQNTKKRFLKTKKKNDSGLAERKHENMCKGDIQRDNV